MPIRIHPIQRIPGRVHIPIVREDPPRIGHHRIWTDELAQPRVVVAGVVVVETGLVFLLAGERLFQSEKYAAKRVLTLE